MISSFTISPGRSDNFWGATSSPEPIIAAWDLCEAFVALSRANGQSDLQIVQEILHKLRD